MRPRLRVLCAVSVLLVVVSPAFAASEIRAPRVAAVEKSSKLSADLRDLAAERTTSASRETTVQVVIETDDVDAVRDRLRTAGGTFERSARDLVLARVPIASLESIAASSAVHVVRRPRTPVLFQTTSEGVAGIGATAWHNAGRKGAGVKVAILDVGFSGYSSLMGTELPNIPASHVQSFSGDISGNGEEHGTAVAEIVYDLAPQADLYLVNFGNEVELDNAVDWLIEQHVDIINTSWGNPCGGPLDGTGRTNELVQRAANAGILWVAAAGNFAQRHWSGTFDDSNGNSWHNFTANEDGNTVYLNSGDELRVCVEWDDWTNKNIDLDLYVWDTGGYEVASSKEEQSGPSSNDPSELLTFTASYSGDYYIGVKRYSGARNPRLHMFAYPPGAECAIEAVASAQQTPRGVVDELRQFRDTVLASSATGRAWTRAYYRHSTEVKRILLMHPMLAIEAASLMSESRSIIRSVLDRTPHVLTADYTTRIDRFLGRLIEHASPALREELSAFRTTAALPTATGQTAAQYWDALLGARNAMLERATYPDSGYMLHTVVATSLTPPADSPHAFTAGAVNWSTGALETFSSRGPTADGRRKPDLAGPDGVCTTTYGACGADGFLGTSAAAPHVAGAAALVKQANPSMNLTAIRNFLTGRAVDVAPAGPDNDTGAGRLALGSTSNVDLLPAPTLLQPSGTSAPLSPTYVWSEVNGASSYRVMVSANLSALPADPTSQTCSGCVVNTTSPYADATPALTLLPSTTYYWQVQGRATNKSGAWAQGSFKTAAPPEQTPPVRFEVAEEPSRWTGNAGKAIVVTHGWNSSVAGTWVQEMAESLCIKKLGETNPTKTATIKANKLTRMCQSGGWDVWVMDWSSLAALPYLPTAAYNNASYAGELLASRLKAKNYTHIHFIAHSAGSNLIESATRQLKANGSVAIHQTFLDAYHPFSVETRYGAKADWADNYVDTRDLVRFHFGFDGTQLFLRHAYNVDMTGTPSSGCGMTCRHSRPYRFYGISIDPNYVGVSADKTSDPIASSAGTGYLLSQENGRTPASLNGTHHVGTTCVVSGSGCTYEVLPPIGSAFNQSGVTGKVNASAGVVTFTSGPSLFQSIRLGVVPANGIATPDTDAIAPDAEPTEAPSWIAIDATTTEPANVLRFRWRLGAAGQAFLRVFVDGTLVREIDQRYVPVASSETEEIYVGGPNGPLAAGTHRIVFRLDGYGSKASGVELTNIELGTIGSGMRRRVMRH